MDANAAARRPWLQSGPFETMTASDRSRPGSLLYTYNAMNRKMIGPLRPNIPAMTMSSAGIRTFPPI